MIAVKHIGLHIYSRYFPVQLHTSAGSPNVWYRHTQSKTNGDNGNWDRSNRKGKVTVDKFLIIVRNSDPQQKTRNRLPRPRQQQLI